MRFRIAPFCTLEHFVESRGKLREKSHVEIFMMNPDGMGHILAGTSGIRFIRKVLAKNQISTRFGQSCGDLDAQQRISHMVEHVDQDHQVESLFVKWAFFDGVFINKNRPTGMCCCQPPSIELQIMMDQGIAAHY